MPTSIAQPDAGTMTSRSSLVIDRGARETNDVVARVRRIQEVMRAVMKDGTHYGTIPGTQKPTLYKPGAELLLTTFRIAPTPERIEDLSTDDEIRYRVTVRGTHQVSGEVIAEMVGECSSNEEKYRWRKPVCREEFDDTPEDRRREKWARGRNGAYKQQQVRTSPADIANTVLKMATKRGLIAMTLAALAASDIFAQDLEDLPEEVRNQVAGDERAGQQPLEPQRRSQANGARTATPDPTNTPVKVSEPVAIERVTHETPAGKKAYFAIFTKGDGDRRFTVFTPDRAKEAEGFANTDYRVRISYQEATVGDRTFYNLVSLAIAEPAENWNPFIADREPGADG